MSDCLAYTEAYDARRNISSYAAQHEHQVWLMWASVLLPLIQKRDKPNIMPFCNTWTFLIHLSSLRAWYVSVFTLDGSSAALTWSRYMYTVYKQMLPMTRKHTNIIYDAGFYFIKQVMSLQVLQLFYIQTLLKEIMQISEKNIFE